MILHLFVLYSLVVLHQPSSITDAVHPTIRLALDIVPLLNINLTFTVYPLISSMSPSIYAMHICDGTVNAEG